MTEKCKPYCFECIKSAMLKDFYLGIDLEIREAFFTYYNERDVLITARYIETTRYLDEYGYVWHNCYKVVPFSKDGWKVIAGGIKC